MDITILIALAAVTFAILLSIGLFFNSKRSPKLNLAENVNRQGAAGPRARDAGPRRAQIARNRGVRMRANARLQHDESEEENEHVERDDNLELSDEKIGAKKRAKLEAKAEKKAQREAEEQQRQEKKKRDQQADDERKKVDEKKHEEEKRLEEEERRAKEEKERREHEEYLKMKEAFSVEEEGYEEGEEGEEQNLLQEFVNYIKKNKVVVIEDLAAQFKLKTQAAIDRIQDLQKDDILTGVIDDRGKFIYVSPQEMEDVAKFIRQRGRVSIAELAENSNNLITLTPSTAVV